METVEIFTVRVIRLAGTGQLGVDCQFGEDRPATAWEQGYVMGLLAGTVAKLVTDTGRDIADAIGVENGTAFMEGYAFAAAEAMTAEPVAGSSRIEMAQKEAADGD